MATRITAAQGASDVASEVLQGRITAYTAAPIWNAALETLARNPNRRVIVDASRLEYIDDVSIALLFDLIRRDPPAGA
jgi:anti-anti-sigma regulatory factor